MIEAKIAILEIAISVLLAVEPLDKEERETQKVSSIAFFKIGLRVILVEFCAAKIT